MLHEIIEVEEGTEENPKCKDNFINSN